MSRRGRRTGTDDRDRRPIGPTIGPVRVALAVALSLSVAAPAARADPPQPPLPEPYATPFARNPAERIGWPEGAKPKAVGPFQVTLWADGLGYVRWLHELPNGDVLAAEAENVAGSGVVKLLRDADGDGRAEPAFEFLRNETGNLNQPFGMALVGSRLYVANTDGLWRYPYKAGANRIAASKGRKLLDLPSGGAGHWTRNVLASPDGRKLYVTVGSDTNAAENGVEPPAGRAAILEYDVARATSRVFASGLRNPNGLGWNPVTGKLWTAVNERDRLGDDLVPDFVTSVKKGGFYGWPYYYFGDNPDPRHAGERPDLADATLVPDLAVGAHTSSIGLAFYTGTAFPERYRGGMFIAQHGSWNRASPVGYRVAFVPFDANGSVAGAPQPFLKGFLADRDPPTAYGRPAGVIMLKDGSLLVSDDAGGRIWRIAAKGPDDGAPALGGLMLFDAARDKPIYPLGDGMVLDPAKLGTARFNVVAAASGPVGSVRFTLDGAEARVENDPPYSFAPHRVGANGRLRYDAWTPAQGVRTLVATPFSGPDATGVAGRPVSVTFTMR